jgi:hypothetical protein
MLAKMFALLSAPDSNGSDRQTLGGHALFSRRLRVGCVRDKVRAVKMN